MARDVFISYSSIDKDIADAVCSTLEARGVSCWIAPRDITPGKAFSEAIIDGIQSSKVFILVYSSNSNHSAQVIKEVDRAVHHGLSIINLRLDDEPLSKKLEYYISDVHWMDAMTSPLEQHLQKLLDVVQILLKPEEVKDAEIAEALRKGIIKQKETSGISKGFRIKKRKTILASGLLLIIAIVVVYLLLTNIFGAKQQPEDGSIESIVVLPFNNYTGDNKLETTIGGMHVCLIDDIGRLSGLRVINSTTTYVYKNAGMSIQEIAQELDVDAALEISIISISDSLIIKVKLIRAFPNEESIWHADYKEETSQTLNLYNRLTVQIASELKIGLTRDEELILKDQRTVDPDALFAYMKGKFYWERFGKEDMDSAEHYFQIAIDIDPEWGDPYSGMALTWKIRDAFGFVSTAISKEKTKEYFNEASRRDTNSANYHFVKALMIGVPSSEKEYLRSLKINPNNALCRIYYAHLLLILNRYDEAKVQDNLAVAVAPMDPLVLGLSAAVKSTLGDLNTAYLQCEKALQIDPYNWFVLQSMPVFYWERGDTLKWYKSMKEINWYLTTGDNLAYLDTVFQKSGVVAVIKEVLKTFKKEYDKGNAISLADWNGFYLMIGNYDKALDIMELMVEKESVFCVYFGALPLGYPELMNNKRYIALMEKLDFPIQTRN